MKIVYLLGAIAALATPVLATANDEYDSYKVDRRSDDGYGHKEDSYDDDKYGKPRRHRYKKDDGYGDDEESNDDGYGKKKDDGYGKKKDDGYGKKKDDGYGKKDRYDDEESYDHHDDEGYGVRKHNDYDDEESNDYGRKERDNYSDDDKKYRKHNDYSDDDEDKYGRRDYDDDKDDYERRNKYEKEDSYKHKKTSKRSRKSYDTDGYDTEGYNKDGYNRDGYNVDGYNKEGQYGGTQYNKSGRLARGEEEYKQFWSTVQYCDAELALVECMLDCDVVNDFATTKRITKCVKAFTKNLCKDLKSEGVNNGRVNLTKEKCADNAVVAAMYTIGDIQKTTIGRDQTPVELFKADNPDTFTAIKTAVAIQSIVNYGNCLGGSLLNYADTCNSKQYFDKHTNKCVNHILKTCKGGDDDEAITQNTVTLSKILTENPWSEKDLHNLGSGNHIQLSASDDEEWWKHDHTRDDNELQKLSQLIKQSAAVTWKSVDVTYHRHRHSANEAELTVCPNSYASLNYRHPTSYLDENNLWSDKGGITKEVAHFDIPGQPADDVAFHFPAQVYNEETKCFEPKTYTREAGSEFQFSEGTPYDPITPKHGIRDTCENFYTLSMLAWFAGEDTGDYCFSIDKYSVEFLENGEVQDLRFDEIAENAYGRCSNNQNFNAIKNDIRADIAALNGPQTPAEQLATSTDLAVDQATLLAQYVQDPHCATCYKVKWNDPSYCPRHIARFGMHVRCCKSFGHVQDEQCKKDRRKKKCEKGTYSAEWDGVCTKDVELEFTKVVYSEHNKGELQSRTSAYHPNTDAIKNKILHLWATFQAVVKNVLSADQLNNFKKALKFFNCDDRIAIAAEHGYDYGRRQNFPRPYHEEDYQWWNEDRPEHSYMDGHSWCEETNSFQKVKVNWASLISLQPADNKCYASSCLISRYIACSETPAAASNDDYGYKQTSHYIPPYAEDYSSRQFSRSMLSSESTTGFAGLGAIGFVAGIVVVVVAQFTLKQKAVQKTETPYHQQLM